MARRRLPHGRAQSAVRRDENERGGDLQVVQDGHAHGLAQEAVVTRESNKNLFNAMPTACHDGVATTFVMRFALSTFTLRAISLECVEKRKGRGGGGTLERNGPYKPLLRPVTRHDKHEQLLRRH